MEDFLKRAAAVRPTARQLAWQSTEFYAFVHFTVNTFTDREWGLGTEDPRVFQPSEFDADQWVAACRSAGMRGLILTCKHHDGFCLWPSRVTKHSVAASPWKNGEGDLVAEVAAACRRGGLKFGVYLSPWDRHEATYGDSEVYNAFFRAQLRELLTAYGEVFSVWFDGACGEGPNGKTQVYDWDSYYQVIRELQPGAAISVCGPDVRWCGNEAGHCRPSEWSVVPAALLDAEKVAEKSQKVDDGAFSRLIRSDDQDLGSRRAIEHAGDLTWYPAEVNTSIRPGWFYHTTEDDRVRTVDELMSIYESSVGGNATFLLNIPPDRRGRFHEVDVARLQEFGESLAKRFANPLAAISGPRPWRAAAGDTLELVLPATGPVQDVILQEDIATAGQRIEAFALDLRENGDWVEVFRGTVVGYKKLCAVPSRVTDAVRLRVLECRSEAVLKAMTAFGPV